MPRPWIKINIPISMLFKFKLFLLIFLLCWLKKLLKGTHADGIPFFCGSELHASSSLSYVLEMCKERFMSHKNETSKAMMMLLSVQAGVTGAAMSGVVAGDGTAHKSHTGIPVLHAGSHFRHGLLQLMIHTIDPLHDGE